jgi:hypothetical protein
VPRSNVFVLYTAERIDVIDWSSIIQAPGSLFHASQPGHLRFTFTVPESMAKLGLDRFEAALTGQALSA